MDGIGRSQQSGQAHKAESIASSKEASSAELGKQFKQASDGFQEIMPKLKDRIKAEKNNHQEQPSKAEQQIKQMQQQDQMQSAYDAIKDAGSEPNKANPAQIARITKRVTKNHPELAQKIKEQGAQVLKDQIKVNHAWDKHGPDSTEFRSARMHLNVDSTKLNLLIQGANILDIRDCMKALDSLASSISSHTR